MLYLKYNFKKKNLYVYYNTFINFLDSAVCSQVMLYGIWGSCPLLQIILVRSFSQTGTSCFEICLLKAYARFPLDFSSARED